MGNELRGLLEARKATRYVLGRIDPDTDCPSARGARQALEMAVEVLNERIGALVNDHGTMGGAE